MRNQIQQSSTTTFLDHPPARFPKEMLRKVMLLIVSALFFMVALFILASAQLDSSQLTSSVLFDTFIIFGCMYLIFTIATVLGTCDLRKFENYSIVAIIWEFIMFLASGAVIHMLGDAKPTLLFSTIGFYVTVILSLSILFLGEVVQWPISGVLDSLRGLNVAISFSLFKDHPAYTCSGMYFCFIMICVIRRLQVWRREAQGVHESGSTTPNEGIQPPLTSTDEGHAIETPVVEIPESSSPEFLVTVDQHQIPLGMAADVAGDVF